MKPIQFDRKTGVKAGVAGLLLTTALAAGAVWAGKEDDQIPVNTNSTTCLTDSECGVMDPFQEILRMQDEMDRFFGSPVGRISGRSNWGGGFAQPDMDLREELDAYHVQMDLPGMDKSGIAVDVKENVLFVSANSKKEMTRKDGDKLLMQERSRGFMSRAIRLPKMVDTDKVSAEYKDGVLKITLPKLQRDQPQKRIDIK
ncbi:MAG: Hsp20/alpha crystallin family protein [Kiritimatiellaceae bacterium]|nr:Hsp20/alpha crystallin family protein [Kiritimatiellaceae bacterium]